MIIRPAVVGDIDTLLAWRRERADWLAAHGEDQWQLPWPRWAVAGAVSAGQTWMAWDGQTPAATITLTAGVDLDTVWKSDAHLDPDALWHPEDQPGNALYASKMMVPLAYAGEGLGAELLDWAGGRVYAAELLWLRLDAWTSNRTLHRWYERQGFVHVRTVASRVSGACFQRPAQPYTGWRLKTEEAGPGLVEPRS
jgi:GNAT superfamily N-acetyltransferase